MLNRWAVTGMLVATLLVGACGGGDDDDGDENGSGPERGTATSASGNGATPGTTPSGQPGSVDCPLTAEQVSDVIDSEVEPADEPGLVCRFVETNPTNSLGDPVEVVVRRSNSIVFGDPDLKEVDIGEEAGLDDTLNSLFLRVGNQTIEIQVPGGLGANRDVTEVLRELGELAAASLD